MVSSQQCGRSQGSHNLSRTRKVRLGMKPCVTVGIVTYNSENDISDCLDSLESPLIEAIFVVDNGSRDSTKKIAEEAKTKDPEKIEFIGMDGNFGFGVGCNKAIELASTEYVLILNPDVRIKPGSIENLISCFDGASVAVAVPKITKNGSLQKSLRKFPTLSRTAFEAIVGGKVMSLFNASEIHSKKEMYENTHEIDWATGACWLIRKAYTNDVDNFGEGWFLYSEETELAFKLRSNNKKLVFCPDAVVEHSAGDQHSNEILFTLSQANKLRYLKQVTSKNLGSVYCCFMLGYLLRSRKAPVRYCLKEFLASRNNMDHLAKKMIKRLDGEIPRSLE